MKHSNQANIQQSLLLGTQQSLLLGTDKLLAIF